MDFSDTYIFSTSMDLSDCQLKTVLRAKPAAPEFSLLASSDYHSDEDPDYEPASEEDSNAEDRVEFDSDSSQYLTSDAGSSSTVVMDVHEIIGLYNVKTILTDNSI